MFTAQTFMLKKLQLKQSERKKRMLGVRSRLSHVLSGFLVKKFYQFHKGDWTKKNAPNLGDSSWDR